MAEYLILINEDENASRHRAAGGPAAGDGRAQPFRQAGRGDRRGLIVSGRGPAAHRMTATSIRGDVVTDGPFAENSKEALGGYYLVEARDLEPRARRSASSARRAFGGVEVRPVMVFDGM